MMRYTARRKLELMVAADASADGGAGLLAAHGVTAEELAGWRERHRLYGVNGLKTTKVQPRRGTPFVRQRMK